MKHKPFARDKIITSLEQLVAPQRINVNHYLSQVEQVRKSIDWKVTLHSIEKAIEKGRQ